MSWNLDGKQSIYVQLVRTIRQRIVTGYYKPGERIDSVRELAEEAGVNPNTMQRALTELERDGVLRSERTSGRFVTEDEEMIRKMRDDAAEEVLRAFLNEMRALGYSEKEIQAIVKERLQKEG